MTTSGIRHFFAGFCALSLMLTTFFSVHAAASGLPELALLSDSTMQQMADTASLQVEDTTFLATVQVTATRSQVTMKGDTLVYNADAFHVPPGATIGTLLSRLPGVTVEGSTVRYHGEVVSKLLINGKDFFLGDLSIALENLPSEMIESIKAYETKTDQDKQNDTDTGERLTVLDLTIKKEYMSTWMGNLDLAAGTSDHYSERIFVTRFTDRLNVSAFGQINNLNDPSEASGDGNWSSNSRMFGINTFRKMGANVAWENDKKEDEAGHLRLTGNVRASHDNQNNETVQVGETFYPGAAHNYSNSLNGQLQRQRAVGLESRVEWRIDTLTRAYLQASYNHNDGHSRSFGRSATFDRNPLTIAGITDPLNSLLQDTPNTDLLSAAINSNDRRSLSFSNSNQFNSRFQMGRKVGNKGSELFLVGILSEGKSRNTGYSIADIRYYRDSNRPRQINNQHSLAPSSNRVSVAVVGYNYALTKQQSLTVAYGYLYSRNRNDQTLYQLDSLDEWRNTHHQLGTLPSADSLAAAINWRNSSYATTHSYQQIIETQYNFSKDRFYFNLYLALQPSRIRMDYQRDDLDTLLRVNRLEPSANVFLRYSLKPSGYIQFGYRPSYSYPELTQTLSITDDRDPLYIVEGNPNLKGSWNHDFFLQFQTTFGERKHSLWAYLNYRFRDTEISNTMSYDPNTGKQTVRPENVDGTWNISGLSSASITLDNARRFTLSPGMRANYGRRVAFFTINSQSLLNEQSNFSFTPQLSLNYRQGPLYLSWENEFSLGVQRNSQQSATNETSRLFNIYLQGEYELPWGMSLSSGIRLWSTRGQVVQDMNRDQWLWGARMSQSFLKKKNLLVILEAIDILHSRRDQWSFSDAYSRTTSFTNSFNKMSYVMLHLNYKFSVGKKAQ